MIPIADAEQQARVLDDAAKASPIRTIAAMLRVRAAEWRLAAKWATDAADDEHDPMIVPAALVEQGNRVWWGGTVCDVVRVTNGGMGIQIAEPGFGARWENRFGPQSPVVVIA